MDSDVNGISLYFFFAALLFKPWSDLLISLSEHNFTFSVVGNIQPLFLSNVFLPLFPLFPRCFNYHFINSGSVILVLLLNFPFFAFSTFSDNSTGPFISLTLLHFCADYNWRLCCMYFILTIKFSFIIQASKLVWTLLHNISREQNKMI